MLCSSYTLSLLLAASAVIASPFPLNGRTTSTPHWNATALKPPKAIYFLTNDPAGNSIVALNVGPDGLLSDGSITPTGGKGASSIDGATNQPAAPDALSSQSALKVEKNMMVAVNPGSNTIAMLNISVTDPTKLTMIGQPVNTMGEFPVTAAISTKNHMACVGNTGAQAGIACFSMHHKTGLKPLMESQIAFPINQTTPPVGPANTVSQVLFNEDETMLLTPVKGDPAKNNTGFLSLLPVHHGCAAEKDTRSSPAGTSLLFGTALIPGTTDILATDPTFGAAVISTTTPPAVVHKATIADQMATCWAAFSPFTKTAFVTDVLVNRLVEIDPASGAVRQSTDLNDGQPGLLDIVAGGKMVYALSPGNGTTKSTIAVMDVSVRPAKLVQSFQPEMETKSSQGLTAVF
ncbi:MAG: hypothetical protein LQ343_002216 [Gyalolechia ehrenbergii]|nr:MAG: hypothetical protein LQ343_002216 [Gyalolechia ehrenbergii]